MKKLFEKPVIDVLFFDEEDIVTDSGNGNRSMTSLYGGSNAERAGEGIGNSVLTVERASELFD
ncbi:MAG: hypothetical protein Q4G33_12200 [bacterium]|nr:hypothetical protein [bacterium]